MKSYYLFYKPYGVLSQFTRENGHKALCDFGPFPKNIYPAGRLDADSEGLLFLTDDNITKHRLTDPKYEHEKTYILQVEGIPNESEIEQLRGGVIVKGKLTKPAKVQLLDSEPDLPQVSKPIRFRKNIPTAWLKITLREGRNRQIRRMTAAINHPVLRLIRTSILFFDLKGLKPGKYRELTPQEIKRLNEFLLIY